MLRQVLDQHYRRTRGLPTGLDERLSDRDLASFAAARAGQLVRGAVRLRHPAYVAAGVELRHRHRLRLGRGVALGAGVRINALSVEGVGLGDQVTVDTGAIIRGSGVVRHLGVGVRVGARSAIGAHNVILGQGGVEIGEDCLLGPMVSVLSENHVFADREVPIREQGEAAARTVVGDDVWIGAGAVVLGGVTIGSGAVVAAGAVVTRPVEEYSVVGGVPARQLSTR